MLKGAIAVYFSGSSNWEEHINLKIVDFLVGIWKDNLSNKRSFTSLIKFRLHIKFHTRVKQQGSNSLPISISVSLSLSKPWGTMGSASSAVLILKLALRGDEWSVSFFGRFVSGARAPSARWAGGCVSPRDVSDNLEKRTIYFPSGDSSSDSSLYREELFWAEMFLAFPDLINV
jgi:hypothetical protein